MADYKRHLKHHCIHSHMRRYCCNCGHYHQYNTPCPEIADCGNPECGHRDYQNRDKK